MKLYSCSNCKNLLYFENSICLQCNHQVGFHAPSLSMITLDAASGGVAANIQQLQQKFRYCQNSISGACNWLVDDNSASPLCLACNLNRVIPDLRKEVNLEKWIKIEAGKHRLIYSLLRLKLPIHRKKNSVEKGLCFDFMEDTSPAKRVMTGHAEGVITLNIEEADEDKITKHKINFREKYRTLLGHFRHEVGHYYWDVLIHGTPHHEEFRKLFGDESKDYSEALKAYYHAGPIPNWYSYNISAYATAHPWEDWAESWSHYLHMMDTLETAYAFGINLHPEPANNDDLLNADITIDPYELGDFIKIINLWLPLTFAVNSLNRSMGHADFYPFVISQPAIQKLSFIHKVCRLAAIANVNTALVL